VDLQAAALRDEIERPGRRFVMIIDDALRMRKVFTYDDHSSLPSPLEFLAMAEKLRARRGAAAENNSRPAPDCRARHLVTTRRHKHQVPQIACLAAILPAMQLRASWLRAGSSA
jgi:hypothetical protein